MHLHLLDRISISNRENLEVALIVSISSGGLGNQLFRFFAALNFSLKSNRPLVVDVSGFKIKNEREKLLTKREFELIDYTKFHEFAKVKSFKKSPPNWPYRLRNLPAVISAASGVVCESNYHLSRRSIHKQYAIDDFQSLRFLPESSIILDFFDSLQHKPDWLTEKIRIAESTKPVFIHIRLTDYLNYPEIYPIPKPEYYIKALQYLTANLFFDEVWLFSDDPELAFSYLKDQITNLRIADVPRDARPSEVLELMSHGAGLVIGNSTFSWWSAYLAKLRDPEIRVVMPNKFTILLNDATVELHTKDAYIIDLDNL